MSALRACLECEDCTWALVKAFTRRPSAKLEHVRVDSLATLWEWLQMHRLVVNAVGKVKVWCDGGTRCA